LTHSFWTYFLEAKQLSFVEAPVPLSVQMLRQRTNANTSCSITTAIGASLETLVLRKNFCEVYAHKLRALQNTITGKHQSMDRLVKQTRVEIEPVVLQAT